MKHTLLAMVMAVALAGCGAILPYVVAAGQVAQWIATVLDQAEAAADAHFAHSPNPGLEAKVDSAVAKTRGALAALDEAVLAAEATDDGRVEDARTHLLAAYDELYKLLETSGLLGSDGLLGSPGQPLELPAPADVEARIQ